MPQTPDEMIANTEDDKYWKKLKLEWRPLLVSLGVLTLATGVAAVLSSKFNDNSNVMIIYMLAVAVIASITPGYLYGIVASVVSVIGVNYFFAWPQFGFNFTQSGYPVTFASLLIVSIITSTLMTRYRDVATTARQREMRTKTLYDLTDEFLTADDAESYVRIACEHLSRVCEAKTRYLPVEEELPEDAHPCVTLPVAMHDHRFGTLYVPDETCAAAKNESTFVLMQMIAYQLALALERNRLIQEHRNVQLQADAEKMRGNLLRAVSHDLRTPLTSILGASATILESGDQLSDETNEQLVEDIHDNSQWLIRMVENLLSVTKIGDGTAAINKTPEVLEEIIGHTIAQLRKRFPDREMQVRVPDEILVVPMDAMLVEQVLLNLVENVFYHANTDGPAEITVRDDGDAVTIVVRDHGDGIDPKRLDTIFEGTGKSLGEEGGDTHRGMGIGLSICQAIAKAHRGEIRAHNACDGGAVFEFTLPKEDAIYEQQDDTADC